MIRPIATLAGMLLLAGCAWIDGQGFYPLQSPPSEAAALAQIEVISLVNTRKTVADHLASAISGKDCSTVEYERRGAWCVDRAPPPPPPREVYCYRTLGRANCFSHPLGTNDTMLGHVPPSIPVR